MNEKKLMRSTNKMFTGVCAGIAEYFDIDPTIVRAVYAVFSLFSGCVPGVILYAVLALVMPQRS